MLIKGADGVIGAEPDIEDADGVLPEPPFVPLTGGTFTAVIALTVLIPVAIIAPTLATFAITSNGDGNVDFCFNASEAP